MLSARTLLVRGMLVGAAAGVLAFLFAWLVGEGPIEAAIALETAAAKAAGEPDEPELVSRTVQSTFGLATATIVYAIALGGIFAIGFAFAYGRIGRLGVRATAAVVALGGFVTVALVPFLKYPPSPPAVGSPDTIGRRTSLYFLMVVISVAAAALAVYLGRSLAPRFDAWDATLLAVGGYVVIVAVAQLLLPTVDEVAAGFPADLLWDFRLASLGTQLITWTTFGLLFGALTERSLRGTRSGAHLGAPTG